VHIYSGGVPTPPAPVSSNWQIPPWAAPGERTENLTTVFDTGQGIGPYDQMTYSHYESYTEIDPDRSFEISAIQPNIYFCNGTCFYVAEIWDQGTFLGATSWQGTNAVNTRAAFKSKIRLSEGKTYGIRQRTWTTKSVGILTTGARTFDIIGRHAYRHTYASMMSPYDRGSISFKLESGN
jgi:hypothetical protein